MLDVVRQSETTMGFITGHNRIQRSTAVLAACCLVALVTACADSDSTPPNQQSSARRTTSVTTGSTTTAVVADSHSAVDSSLADSAMLDIRCCKELFLGAAAKDRR